MSDDNEELEAIRAKKAQQHQQNEEKKKNVEEQLKTTLRVVLDDSAYQRLMNVKIANQALFLAASQHIVGIFKQVGRKLTDNEVLMILRRLKESNDKETTITFNRK